MVILYSEFIKCTMSKLLMLTNYLYKVHSHLNIKSVCDWKTDVSSSADVTYPDISLLLYLDYSCLS